MNIMIHEILDKVAAAATRKEKGEVLLKYNCLALRDVLRGAFDDSIEFTLPSGTPPYTPDDAPAGYSRTTLHQQTKKLKYFVKGGPGDRLSNIKRERMFIDVLESLHPEEAKLILLMKDKKLAGVYKGLTKKVVQDTWPRLIIK